jgi:2-oxoisovalerate dehydrogenase E1 component alpha subunit
MEFVLDDLVTVLGPGGVADPTHDPGMPDDLALKLFKHMVLTRTLDERLVTLQRQGRIGFHIGGMGEEATILGSAAALREQDWLFPCYREFGALLWRGMPLQRYLDNMYGNANDPVKGRQMPDHYSGRPYNFGSVSSPIGTQITQAVGFAWAAKLRKEDLVALVYFGDGATSSNEFHNGANFAGVFKTPSVFVCRNNGWAISVPVERQTASRTFAQKAFAYGIHPVRVDGNDLLAVWKVTRDAVARAAKGEGTTLIEAVTYRLSGHSTSDDPKAYRKEQEMLEERKKDPIPRFRAYVERKKLWDAEKEKAWIAEIDADIKKYIEAAEKAPTPALRTMFEDVFKEMPWHLREQLAQCEAAPRPTGHGGH